MIEVFTGKTIQQIDIDSQCPKCGAWLCWCIYALDKPQTQVCWTCKRKVSITVRNVVVESFAEKTEESLL